MEQKEAIVMRDGTGVYGCQNCGLRLAKDDMRPLPEKGILERVAPGEPMPHGECPECGAVVHPVEVSFRIRCGTSLVYEFLGEHCAARSMDDAGDRLVTATMVVEHLRKTGYIR